MNPIHRALGPRLATSHVTFFHSSQGHFRLLLILYRANNFFLSTFANLSPLFFFPSIYSKVKGFSKLKSKLTIPSSMILVYRGWFTWNSYFICQTSIKANPIKTFSHFSLKYSHAIQPRGITFMW